jgi:hypothetical protein
MVLSSSRRRRVESGMLGSVWNFVGNRWTLEVPDREFENELHNSQL